MGGKLSEERDPREGSQERAKGVLVFLCSQNVVLWACFWAKGLQGRDSPGRGLIKQVLGLLGHGTTVLAFPNVATPKLWALFSDLPDGLNSTWSVTS